MWLSWNKEIGESSPSDLPAGLVPEDGLLYICGSYFLAEGGTMDKFYAESLEFMERTAPDFRKMQFVKVCTDEMAWLKTTQLEVADKPNYHRVTPKMKNSCERSTRSGLRSIISSTRSIMVIRMASLISMVGLP